MRYGFFSVGTQGASEWASDPLPCQVLSRQNFSMQQRPYEVVDLRQRGVEPIIVPDFGIARNVEVS